MSRIYFHSPSADDVAVLGTERHWFGQVVNRIGIGFLDIDNNLDALMATMPGSNLESVKPEYRAKMMATTLSVGMGDEPTINGERYETFAMFLNTALALGNDGMKLAARIHGQCEMHAWVAGPNRAWLADIIEAADTGVFRPGSGWAEVVTLLRSRDDKPVVSSYSVTDSFPNSYASDWNPWPEGVAEKWDALSPEAQEARSERDDEWYELPKSEQWQRSLAWLTESNNGQEMKPDNWSTMRFVHKLDSLQFINLLRDENRKSAVSLQPTN